MEMLMKLKNKLVFLTGLSLLSQSVSAVPFTFEGRSLGMGGASTATADLATAVWANPAMLTNQRPDDDFSLLIGLGAFARDNDDLVTDINDFQDANDRLTAAENAGDAAGATAALQDMSNAILSTADKDIAADVSGVMAFGIAFDSFAMAFGVRADAIGAGTVTDTSCVLGDTGCDPVTFRAQATSDQYNILNVEGVLATEFGVAFAKDFQVFNRKLSVGIKPKLVDLQAFTYRDAILNISGTGDVLNSDNRLDLGTFTSVDLGLAADISESFRLGLNVRNLLTDTFDLKGQTLNFDTNARLGIAYHSSLLTVAVDYDLTENKPLLANSNFDDLKTRYLMAGIELNAFDYVQFRAGAAKNVASGVSGSAGDTTLSAGLGFWLGFNLDLAATYRNGAVGGFLQTGFRF